jgi:hypothetical protein
MKRNIKSLFSLVLLLYFSCFAVAPVSVVLPSEQLTDLGAQQDVLEKRTDKTAVFLYDLALWEVLKKVKHSDDSKNNLISNKKSDNAPSKSCTEISLDVTGVGNAVSLPNPDISAHHNIGISAVQQYAYFDHSGLSPPFLA